MHTKILGKPITLMFTVLGAWAAWQAVRFCQGEVFFPGLEKSVFDATTPFSLLGYYVTGISAWLAVGVALMGVGQLLDRYLTVGGRQLWWELRQSVR